MKRVPASLSHEVWINTSMTRAPESPSPQGRGRGGVTAIRLKDQTPRPMPAPLRAFARNHPTLNPSPEGREAATGAPHV